MIDIRFERFSGTKAFGELRITGLLDESVGSEMPHSVFDLEVILADTTAFCLIGYVDEVPVGYVVAQTYWHGKFTKHLFIHQAWSKAGPVMNEAAGDWLIQYAQMTACDAIATIVPMKLEQLMHRRYGFAATGVYMTRSVGHGH